MKRRADYRNPYSPPSTFTREILDVRDGLKVERRREKVKKRDGKRKEKTKRRKEEKSFFPCPPSYTGCNVFWICLSVCTHVPRGSVWSRRGSGEIAWETALDNNVI